MAKKAEFSQAGPFRSVLLNSLSLWSSSQSALAEESLARAALGLYNAFERCVSTALQIIDDTIGDGTRTLEAGKGRGLKMLKQGVRDEVRG
ncbi:hypothetical protein TrRE_jg13206, partial [Triparma retinervis]